MTDAPESLRLFAICSAMEFNHLPAPGGLYDQDPELLDQWLQIWQEKSKYEEAEERRKKASRGGQGAAPKSRPSRRPRR